MSKKPWYAAGLRFRCIGCGGCCTGEPGHVWVNRHEIAALADFCKLELAEFESRYVRRVGVRKSLIELAGGDCVFYDAPARRCGVYSLRPRQCRTWPFWPSNLRSPEAWAEVARRCPGANRGKLYTLVEIEELAGVMYV